MQTGFSSYTPKHVEWKEFYPYQEMLEMVKDARIVITHGGPSSFIMPLQISKIPIVVPREKQYGEHVNNHQVDFCREVANRMGTIIEVENMQDLARAIEHYDYVISQSKRKNESNNAIFCEKLKSIVVTMFEGSKQ